MGCMTNTGVNVPHVSWIVQWYTNPMCHVLYNIVGISCIMGCTMVQILYIPHVSWVVQWYIYCMANGLYNNICPMEHGVCNNRYTPCPMGCATIYTLCPMGCATLQMAHTLHGSWVVQWYIYPCIIGCAMVYMPMYHGLCNDIYPMYHGLHTS